MNDKPGLKLEIAGRVDPVDREGLRRAMLLGKVEALEGQGHGEAGRIGRCDDGA